MEESKRNKGRNRYAIAFTCVLVCRVCVRVCVCVYVYLGDQSKAQGWKREKDYKKCCAEDKDRRTKKKWIDTSEERKRNGKKR